jgi:hypothetical protein
MFPAFKKKRGGICMSDAERNIRLIELGYYAKSQGLELNAIKEAIAQLHSQ